MTNTEPDKRQFNSIHVQGFRRLHSLKLKLRSLCVVIGANGSGKTSLLDVFSLLAASASGDLNEKISEFGGMTSMLTVDRPPHEESGSSTGSGTFETGMSFHLSLQVPQFKPLEYGLTLAPIGVAHEITEENLTQQREPQPPPMIYIQSCRGDIHYYNVDRKGLERPDWTHNPIETALSQVPKMFREPEDFRSRLASSTYYHALNVEPRAPVRLPQLLRPAPLPGQNGEDLVSCLFYLRETQRDRFEAVEDAMRAGFPGFERLDFPPVAAGTLAMTWKDSNFSHPLFMHQLSEGTLRFLWLVTLLQSPGLTAVTLLDEPEVSLHPELLSLLADLMREASEHTQLIVATHADRLVRFLEPKEVVTLDLDEGGTAQATWADELDLDEWLQEYTLDEVWRLGRMGGRP